MSKKISLAEFQHRMRKADQRIVKSLFEKLTILSLKAERQGKLNATDYPRVRTGRLRSSITGLVDTKEGKPRMLLRAGGNSGGAPVRYAHFIEFGAPRRNIEPRLFLGRAMQQIQQNDVTKELKDLLSLALSEDR
ncbi:MAG: hypothetical protein AAF403_00925 [Pseudomonadota bacterium]